jgi:hypothetical protein
MPDVTDEVLDATAHPRPNEINVLLNGVLRLHFERFYGTSHDIVGMVLIEPSWVLARHSSGERGGIVLNQN